MIPGDDSSWSSLCAWAVHSTLHNLHIPIGVPRPRRDSVESSKPSALRKRPTHFPYENLIQDNIMFTPVRDFLLETPWRIIIPNPNVNSHSLWSWEPKKVWTFHLVY
jgi:hypothetical protein